jgi:hypothetical protein
MSNKPDFGRNIFFLKKFQSDVKTNFANIFKFQKNKLYSEDNYAGLMGALLTVHQKYSAGAPVRTVVGNGLADGNAYRADFIQAPQNEAMAYALANGTHKELCPEMEVINNTPKATKKDLKSKKLSYTAFELGMQELAIQSFRMQAFGLGFETNGLSLEQTAEAIAFNKAFCPIYSTPISLEACASMIENTAEQAVAISTFNFSEMLGGAVLHMGYLNLGLSLGLKNFGPSASYTGAEGTVGLWGSL